MQRLEQRLEDSRKQYNKLEKSYAKLEQIAPTLQKLTADAEDSTSKLNYEERKQHKDLVRLAHNAIWKGSPVPLKVDAQATKRLQQQKKMTTSVTTRGVVATRAVFMVIAAVCLATFGFLELRDLQQRSAMTLQSTLDSECFVHVYPWTANDTGLIFEIQGTDRKDQFGAELGPVAFAAVTDSGRELELDVSKQHKLVSRQCTTLLFDVDNTSSPPRVSIHDVVNGSTLPVMFDTCSSSAAGSEHIFIQQSYSIAAVTSLAMTTLCLWVLLRCMAIAREFACLEYETLYPVWPEPEVDEKADTARDQGARHERKASMMGILPEALTQRRLKDLQPARIFHMILRPYFLYAVVPAQLLKPWTSIYMHDECPQLIMQTGSVDMTILSCLLGAFVLILMTLIYAVDLVLWQSRDYVGG